MIKKPKSHSARALVCTVNDVFGKNLLAGYERMIQNGYDANRELHDAPVNSWFGYYTMEGKPGVVCNCCKSKI